MLPRLKHEIKLTLRRALQKVEKKNIQFLTLDSLRGLAAIVVVIYHHSAVQWGGYLMVDFFLVLSGFILSHNYLYSDTVKSPVDFISHRLARLYPLHIYTLVTFILVSVIIGRLPVYQDGNLFTLLQQITLTQNIGLNPHGITWNHPSWSISVELWLNIIFIFFISKATRNITLFLVSLLCLLVIYHNTGHLDTHYANYHIDTHYDDYYFVINSGMLRGLTSFLIGILSYRMYLHYKNDTRMEKYINYIEALCVLGVFALVLGRPIKVSHIDVLAPFLFMLVVFAFSFERGWLSKHLRKLSYLGVISYSIYLNQITVLFAYYSIHNRVNMPYILDLLIYLAILIIYSHFTYKFIEWPLRRKGRDLLSRMAT